MDPAMQEARARLAARAGNARTGGKGSVRRKRKATHKTASNDDKKLTSALKRVGVTPIPGIEEANLFKQNGQVIHFNAPKVQASVGANTYVIQGTAENKTLQELLPGVIQQLGTDNLAQLRQIAESMGAGMPDAGAAAAAAEGDDVPAVEDFETASE